MNTTQKTAAVAFLVTFVAVVAVGGVVSAVTGGGGNTAELPEVENPQYDADRVSPDATPGTANIQMDSSANGETIVVSVGGGVNERDIEPVVNTLIESGAEVNVSSSSRVSCSGTWRGPLPGPRRIAPAGLRRPTAARSSWTRSATSRWSSRRSCLRCSSAGR